ncbi:MAG: ABC transporter ATP-binding protein [Desulfitobacteriaceae bacterium]
MLVVDGLTVAYRNITVLRNVSLEVRQGEIVTLIGANGAGKSTLLRTIAGLHKPSDGHVVFEGADITGLKAYKVVKKGLSMVPEGRQLFAGLSVMDNLLLGSLGQSGKRNHKMVEDRISVMLEIFSRLKERTNQLAGTLSGGEQQMLAISRGLMSNPKFLMLDEPSLGLAPIVVQEIFALIQKLNRAGVSIFLVEQNAYAALEISNRGYVLENGRIAREGQAAELLNDEGIRYHYLGGRAV